MEKILLIIDARQVNWKAVDFACNLATLTHSRLTGVFLENLLHMETPVLSTRDTSLSEGLQTSYSDQDHRKGMLTDENIRLFKKACEEKGVEPLIHRDRGLPGTEIVAESRFADLMIADAETSFSKNYECAPALFIKYILQGSECPVIVFPDNFGGMDEIIFTYDATRSSVFAIKQFTYLFPELRRKKAIVLNVNSKEKRTLKEKHQIKEWLGNHYSDVEFVVLEGAGGDELFDWLREKKNAMVVMGAYGRSLFSRFLTPSHAGSILKNVNLPLFIAHY